MRRRIKKLPRGVASQAVAAAALVRTTKEETKTNEHQLTFSVISLPIL